MTSIALTVYMLSIALSSMALGLAVASSAFTKAKWNSWSIVFQSCLLFLMVTGFLLTLSASHPVLETIFRYIQHAVMGFVLIMLPLLVSFIVGKPWSGTGRAIFYPLGALYVVSGFTPWIRPVQTAIFLGVLLFCIGELWRNLGKIEDRRTRSFILSLNIVVVALVPTTVLLILFPEWDQIGFPLYVIAFSILLLSFFYNRFSAKAREEDKKNVHVDLSEYRITERESEVIDCICRGMTNKEIAKKLNISVNTVNNHVANIFEKMNISSRIDLLRKVKGSLWS